MEGKLGSGISFKMQMSGMINKKERERERERLACVHNKVPLWPSLCFSKMTWRVPKVSDLEASIPGIILVH